MMFTRPCLHLRTDLGSGIALWGPSLGPYFWTQFGVPFLATILGYLDVSDDAGMRIAQTSAYPAMELSMLVPLWSTSHSWLGIPMFLWERGQHHPLERFWNGKHPALFDYWRNFKWHHCFRFPGWSNRARYAECMPEHVWENMAEYAWELLANMPEYNTIVYILVWQINISFRNCKNNSE